MLSEQDKDDIEKMIKKHRPSSSGDGCITVLFVMFLVGWFKGCGY